ncbi:MAG: hypothetical protein ACM31G_05890, partial [Flavobacteriales bacterium]
MKKTTFNLLSNTDIKIKHCIFVFVFLFTVLSCYSQILNPYAGTCTNQVEGNCTANSTNIIGAYIGDINGVKVTDDNISNYNDNDTFYVFVDVERNGNKYDLYTQFNLVNLSDGGTNTFVEAFTPGSIVTASYRVNVPITNYITNGEVNSVYGLEDIVISWDNTDDATPTCPTGNYTACNAEIPDIVAVGPFKAFYKYDPILCNGGTTNVTISASGGVEPYTGTGIFNVAAGNYNYIVSDSDGHSENLSVIINEPSQLINTTNSPSLVCSTGTTTATFTASGGTPPYNYVINNNTTGGEANWSTPTLSITNAGSGTITVTFTDSNGCPVQNSITITASDTQNPIVTAPSSPLNIEGCDISIAPAPVTTVTGLEALGFAVSDDATGDSDLIVSNSDSVSGTCPIVITRIYTITDDCGNSSQANQIININAPAIIYNNPDDANVQSCDFANQDAVNTAFNNWVIAQSTAIAETGGCSPVLSNNGASATIPDLCAGGTATVTWTITDLCETINTITADFNLTAPAAVTYNNPDDANVQSCDFANQDAVNTAFNNWVIAQSTAIAEAGGCSPVLSNNSASATIPDLCAGGTATVTWTITDLCETINTITADFNLTAPEALVISDVQDETVPAGTYANQGDLDAAFANWLNNFSVSGGCNPLGQFAIQYAAPALCGGSVNIVYNVTDLCQTGQDIATFTVQSTNPLIISDVQDLTVNACDFADQAALDAAFANWVAGFSVSGGFNPQATDISTLAAPVLCEGGSTSVTYDITDLCESGQDTATFTVTPAAALVI